MARSRDKGYLLDRIASLIKPFCESIFVLFYVLFYFNFKIQIIKHGLQ